LILISHEERARNYGRCVLPQHQANSGALQLRASMVAGAGRARQHTIYFGEFELDLSSQTLSHDGVRAKLQRQPFQVLELLVQRAPAIVSREEIRRHVWGDAVNHRRNAEHKFLYPSDSLDLRCHLGRASLYRDTSLCPGQRFAVQQVFRRNPRRVQRRHHRRSLTLVSRFT
jgi:hypothetical protein